MRHSPPGRIALFGRGVPLLGRVPVFGNMLGGGTVGCECTVGLWFRCRAFVSQEYNPPNLTYPHPPRTVSWFRVGGLGGWRGALHLWFECDLWSGMRLCICLVTPLVRRCALTLVMRRDGLALTFVAIEGI